MLSFFTKISYYAKNYICNINIVNIYNFYLKNFLIHCIFNAIQRKIFSAVFSIVATLCNNRLAFKIMNMKDDVCKISKNAIGKYVYSTAPYHFILFFFMSEI
jgi:hypothetical protein